MKRSEVRGAGLAFCEAYPDPPEPPPPGIFRFSIRKKISQSVGGQLLGTVVFSTGCQKLSGTVENGAVAKSFCVRRLAWFSGTVAQIPEPYIPREDLGPGHTMSLFA